MTDTTQLFATTLITGGMRLEHDVIANDEDGDIPILRLIPGEDMPDDNTAVFEKRAGSEWFCIVQGYGRIAMSSSAFQEAAGNDSQAVLDEVARRLDADEETTL